MAGLARSVAAAILLLSMTTFGFAANKVIIILDASGSMWAQIDGKPKLEIARESLRTVLQSVPGDDEIGFMAYGHREKGSCDDIQLIVPPQAGSASAISAAADSLKFLGKTPLTAAVKQAAEALKYTEDKATVVLITDGLETCGGDPCALGKELKASGVDFTADVVGFGLTADEGKQISCLAENTGGKYIQVSDEKALQEALVETVAAPAPAPAPAPEPAPAPAPKAAEVDYNLIPQAFLKEGGEAPKSDVYYEVFKDDAKGVGGDNVNYGYSGIKFHVPAGNYIVVASSGGAKVEQKVSLTADKATELSLNLNAAEISIHARPAPGAEVDRNAQISIAYPGGTSDANYGEVKFVVPVGETKITVKVGAGEASETMQLVAGQIVDKDIIVGVGKAKANAFYAQGGEKAETDVSWKVYKAAKKLDGSRDQVTYAYGADSQFDLPPGDYVMGVDVQAVSTEQPFSVTVGQMTDVNVTLNAGVLAVDAPGAEGFKIFEAKKNIQGERKQVTYGYGDKMKTTLAAGDYVLVTNFTTDKADKETPFTVKAGERNELKVE
ncbi:MULTISPECIES: vWA domain-containing protein [unclassified Mesorhizobium]|uniref:vWA domain-containing protein n=1 Tax=unclassified Mesorhizobium TaxID=325217 RepID=UPI001CD0158C|nr:MULTISPECIES: VWA domain-containing protein [unclassified Mesorhizobium]MBZ9739226.1 VWA domain-containing protein [Mesorhizobium sp. CO1-1-4]MBZ9801330.1 VWA domain-containing protein [Mesorhizobium sp. ES1-6]